MKGMRTGFGREFRADSTDLKHQLGKRYMKERKDLEAAMAANDADCPLADGFEILRERSDRLEAVIAELKADEEFGKLTSPIKNLAGSYIHMYVNRMLRSAQRAQELVLYDFLVRFYESQIARARKK